LTHTVRTALVPNGLGTTLLAIRNAYRRTEELPSLTQQAMTTHPVVHSRRAALRTRSLVRSSPRRSVKSASVPSELDRTFSPCLSAPSWRGQRYVWSTIAIPHVKDVHPLFARLPSRWPELPPVRSDERCGSRRTRPLRSALSISPTSVLFSSRSEAPIPLMSPSPLELRQPFD